MKLLNEFSGVQAVFFPVGTLENDGTCEFATGECLIKCAAIANSTNDNRIPFKKKEEIYHYFRDKSILEICNQIIKELKESQKPNHKVLYWFASGDCPSELTNKLSSIINMLDEIGISQCGFTRNEKLKKTIDKNVNIVLTVETKGQITRLKEDVRLFGIPNYETGAVDIYYIREKTSRSYVSFSCANPSNTSPSSAMNFGQPAHTSSTQGGETTFTSESVETYHNCRECYDNKMGCFYN